MKREICWTPLLESKVLDTILEARLVNRYFKQELHVQICLSEKRFSELKDSHTVRPRKLGNL